MKGLGRILPAGILLLAGCADSAPDIEMSGGPPGSKSTPIRSDEPRSSGTAAPASTEQLFEEARRAADMGNLGGAAALLEEVIKSEPRHRDALFMLAAIEQDRGSSLDPSKSARPYLRSADVMRQVRTHFKELNAMELNLLRVALYNEARVLATDGKTAKALESLRESIEVGFSNADGLRSDEAFGPIRKESEFTELVKRVEDSARTQVKTKVKALFAENKPATFDFSLPNLDGKAVSSADYRGKVLVVDLWGTWCPPCRREIPHLIELQSKLHDKGVQVIGINYEQVPPEKVNETIATFVKENKITYPCLIGDEKTQERLGGIEGFPTTLFIDRSGKVRAKLVGLFDLEDSISRQGLEELVNTLLTEDAATSVEKP